MVLLTISAHIHREEYSFCCMVLCDSLCNTNLTLMQVLYCEKCLLQASRMESISHWDIEKHHENHSLISNFSLKISYDLAKYPFSVNHQTYLC